MTKETGSVVRLHSSLTASEEGPVSAIPGKPPVKVMLTQGDLDGACGQYCVWMALIALGLASRSWLTDENGKGADRAQGLAWKIGAKQFFSGITDVGVKKMLKPYRPRLDREISRLKGKRLISFVVERLGGNALCLVGVRTGDRKLDHWVLAIGMSGVVKEGKFQANELLLLDPMYGPVPGQAWNATLSTAGATARASDRQFKTPDGKVTLVELDQAVSITLKKSTK